MSLPMVLVAFAFLGSISCELCESRCNETEEAYNKQFVDEKCGRTLRDKENFFRCYAEGGFNRTHVVESIKECGDVCKIPDKTVAYVGQCCFIKKFLELSGQTLEKKRATEEECYRLHGQPIAAE